MLFLLGVPASAQAPSGLIAAWGFDEGNGTVAGAGSGSGNAGSVSGAAWTTQGRFGNALVFDGATSRVTGPSITLGPAFSVPSAGRCRSAPGFGRAATPITSLARSTKCAS